MPLPDLPEADGSDPLSARSVRSATIKERTGGPPFRLSQGGVVDTLKFKPGKYAGQQAVRTQPEAGGPHSW